MWKLIVSLLIAVVTTGVASASTLTTAVVPTPNGPTWVECTLINLSDATISYTYNVISCSSEIPARRCIDMGTGQSGQLPPGAASPGGGFQMIGDFIGCRFDVPGVKKKDVRAGLCIYSSTSSTSVPKACRIFTEAH